MNEQEIVGSFAAVTGHTWQAELVRGDDEHRKACEKWVVFASVLMGGETGELEPQRVGITMRKDAPASVVEDSARKAKEYIEANGILPFPEGL